MGSSSRGMAEVELNVVLIGKVLGLLNQVSLIYIAQCITSSSEYTEITDLRIYVNGERYICLGVPIIYIYNVKRGSCVLQ